MSDTTGSERERGDSGELSDPTSPSYGSDATSPSSETAASDEGAREVTWSSDDTQSVPADGTRPLPPATPGLAAPSAPDPQANPYGQTPPPSPYGQTPPPASPYAAGPGTGATPPAGGAAYPSG
ncbi:MAG TPA: hypothetical protein VH915_04385, partial [Pedococcus sp.]